MKTNFIINDSNKFDWPRFLVSVLRRWFIVVLAAILGFCCIFFTQEYNKTPYYRATAKLFISSGRITQNSAGTTYYSPTDATSAKLLATSYANLIGTDVLLEQVTTDYGENEAALLRNVAVSLTSIEETEYFYLHVTAASKETAVEMCNVLSNSLPKAVLSVVKAGSAQCVTTSKSAVLANPTSYRNSILVAVAAAAVAVGVMLLIFVLDTRIKSVADVKSHYNVAILGEIPSFEMLKDAGKSSGGYSSSYAYKQH